MRHFYFLAFLFLITPGASAQFTTPDAGLTMTLSDLQGEAVEFTDGIYYIHQSIIVAPTDKLEILTDETVKFAKGTYLEIQGALEINPPNEVLFTAQDMTDGYSGVHINESSETIVKKLTLEYAVSFKISRSSPLIEDCIFRYNNHLSSTSFGNGAIAVGFSSNPIIRNNQFLNNRRAAIQSGANAGSAPQIIGNYFEGNNTANVNVPHINLGSSGSDTIRVLNNKVLNAGGIRGGGMSFLGLGALNVIISGNEIKNNRYGINLQGGSDLFSIVSDNRIDSNNIEGNPNLGGSGIAFSGGNASSRQVSIVKRNTFTANLWGITIQGGANPNIGNLINSDTTDDGGNRFINNTNSGVPGVDLYNNTALDIMAQGNYWNTNDPEEIRTKIFDNYFNPSLGVVNFSQYLLPIQLSSFTARYSAGMVLLSWQTESESNSNHFEILRSKDGITFTKVAEIEAAGNSTLPKLYSFEDRRVSASGNYYYQLKMIDRDGTSSLSQIVRVTVGANAANGNNVKLFPTVFSGSLNLTAEVFSTAESTAEVRLLNAQGVLIQHFGKHSLRSGTNQIRITSDLNLPSGMMILQIKGREFEYAQPILKQ